MYILPVSALQAGGVARVEHIAEGIAQQVDPQGDDEDGQTRAPAPPRER